MLQRQQAYKDAALMHAESHSDPLVREAVRALRDENAILRDVIAESNPEPRPRPHRGYTGRILVGIALATALVVGFGVSKQSRRQTFQAGYQSGFRDGTAAVFSPRGAPGILPALPALPAVPKAPLPPGTARLRF